MRGFKKFLKWFFGILVGLLVAAWLISLAAPKNENIEYGLTFSYPYAQSLGLNWQQAYLAILDGLKPKIVRLSAYWDATEPQQDKYDYTALDFLVNQASSRNVKIILAVGCRLPRWPECHDPSWISGMPQADLDNAQLSYVASVVQRYQTNPAIEAWQVENEPFLSTFGICPPLNVNLLDDEIALVKKLDPSRPVIITDSGELDWWFKAGDRGDIFGTTLYRYVYSDVFKRYWTNHIPAIFYRFKAGLLELMHPGKQVAIMELEAEPWTTAGIPNTSVADQMKTMSLNNFNTIVGVAKQTGFSPQIFWGAEWWYYMQTKQNDPEYWNAAQKLMAQ